ncbi:MAG: hypothetical protein F6K22_18190 [Okeania sp. SIO2F4]|uniref:hypothetical protein n=1 Tax=Okeania sp. SIO2F4 TaxID=2607790 RepID=UPI0014299D35|nr:hypothetical protein [Okeania sp. SIO2F4]NES04587.1 hypothetical protein [Okeania sp. SIO2F4]
MTEEASKINQEDPSEKDPFSMVENEASQIEHLYEGAPCCIYDVDIALSLLPVWFIDRMMTDIWEFGLLLTTGQMIIIESINAVSIDVNQELWIEVSLQSENLFDDDDAQHFYGHLYTENKKIIRGTDSQRSKANIKVSHIVAAFDVRSS